MNKTVLISGGLALLLLLGVGAYFVMNQKSSTPPTPVSSPKSVTGIQNEGGTVEKKSLTALMFGSQNRECTFSDPDAGSSGTMYVSAGGMRGDFVSQGSRGTATSHVVLDETHTYVWVEGQTTGFKMARADMEKMATSPQVSQIVNVNKEMDYVCKPWSVDRSKFSLPEGVAFNDMSALIPVAPQGSGPPVDTTSSCAACESLSGETKTQCLTVLGC